MLKVSCGGKIPEGEVRGNCRDLLALAQALRTRNSVLVCATTGSAYPYDRLLGKIVVRWLREEVPRVTVVENSGELEIRGDPARLSTMADNIEALARGGVGGEHWHVEHIPGEPYVAAGSYPIAISLEIERVGT